MPRDRDDERDDRDRPSRPPRRGRAGDDQRPPPFKFPVWAMVAIPLVFLVVCGGGAGVVAYLWSSQRAKDAELARPLGEPSWEDTRPRVAGQEAATLGAAKVEVTAFGSEKVRVTEFGVTREDGPPYLVVHLRVTNTSDAPLRFRGFRDPETTPRFRDEKGGVVMSYNFPPGGVAGVAEAGDIPPGGSITTKLFFYTVGGQRGPELVIPPQAVGVTARSGDAFRFTLPSKDDREMKK